MTVAQLRELNPDLTVYTTADAEFADYGRVIHGIDTSEIVRVAESIELPAEGSSYLPSCEAFEALAIKGEITDRCFGELPTQMGYCWGYSSFLNAWEWHTSSEVNVAVTDLVLLLAKRSELADNRLDAGCAKAFYIKKGEIIEVFATSLHFCPCMVKKSGFGCVVGLPVGTNVPLEKPAADPLLFRKNKWLIAHDDNAALIARGVVPGISGQNIEIKCG